MSTLGRSVSTRLPAKKDQREPSSRPPSIQWPGPSHITTFVRVLRLLNLDSLDDWPSISTSTFSGRVSNLQQSIKATEWALYRLFEVWDPQGTQEKLKPFFPPLAPLQSKNLRAALFRSLSDLKKDGILGKEITLRKTMLDECKGDKFEEVLSSFAMIVVRKATNEARSIRDLRETTVIVSPDQMTPQEEETLLPKILAQRYALQCILSEKRAMLIDDHNQQDTLRQTQESIASVKRDLQRRREEMLNIADTERDKAREAASTFASSWHGDPIWVEHILRLPNKETTPGPSETMHSPVSLLQNLEQRVTKHQDRLAAWKGMAESLEKSLTQTEQIPVRRAHNVVRGFDKHLSMTLSLNEKGSKSASMLSLQAEQYHSLSKSLRESLDAIKQGSSHKKNASDCNIPQPGDDSSTGQAGATIHLLTPNRSTNKYVTESTSSDTSAAAGPPLAENLTAQLSTGSRSSAEDVSKSESPQNTAINTYTQRSHVSSDEVPIDTKCLSSPSRQEQVDVSVTTPVSQSMAVPEDSDDHVSTGEDTPTMSSPTIETPSNRMGKATDRLPIATLLERTRQSMSLLPNPPTRNDTSSTAKLGAKSQQRQSYMRSSMLGVYPVNPWETPNGKVWKGTVVNPESSPELPPTLSSEYSVENNVTSSVNVQSTSSTPRADLFSEDADYDSVFKSRPRIKLSPTPSPERSGLGMGLSWRAEEETHSSD